MPDAFPHAARQFGRLLADDRIGEPDFGQSRQHGALQLPLLGNALLTQRKGHVLAHRHAVEQGRVLKHEAESQSLVRQLPVVQAGQVLVVEMHGAVGWLHQANHGLEQDGLAAAALADDGQRLAAGNLPADPAQHRLPPERDVQVVGLNQRTRSRIVPRGVHHAVASQNSLAPPGQIA